MTKYMYVGNIKKPVVVELEQDANSGGYIVFRKSNLDKIPKPLRKIIFKGGLYEKTESAHNDYDNLFSLHRLVVCCYTNIVGIRTHHILKDVKRNNITNLIPLPHDKHTEIDRMPTERGIEESEKVQLELRNKLFKPKRNTLANDDDLILDILKMKGKADEN